MIVAVKFLVYFRVLDSKVGTEIHNARTGLQEWFSKFRGAPVRQRKKNNVRTLGKLHWLRLAETKLARSFKVRKAGKNLGQRFSGELPRCDCHKVRTWMLQKQAHQLLADVTRSADHRDLC
jgi:hypothetical protein